MANPFAPPAVEIAPSAEAEDFGRRWGMLTVGALGVLEGLLICGAILVNEKPADRWSSETLLLLMALAGGLALPGWGVGRALGGHLQRGGFWRGVGACVLGTLAWGAGTMAFMILMAMVKRGLAGTWWEFPAKLMTLEALEIQGGLTALVGVPTFLGAAFTGGALAWRRRRARRAG